MGFSDIYTRSVFVFLDRRRKEHIKCTMLTFLKLCDMEMWKSPQECIAKLRPQTFNETLTGGVHVKMCKMEGNCSVRFSSIFSSAARIIVTFTFGVFCVFVECIVIVQPMVEHIHNIYTWKVPIIYILRCFWCVPFCISYFNTDCSLISEAICVRSVGEDQSCFGKKRTLVSMICADRLILCCFFSSSSLFFYV